MVDTSRYVAELEGLRTVLLAAKAEQEALEKRVAEVRMRGAHGNVASCGAVMLGSRCDSKNVRDTAQQHAAEWKSALV